MDQVGKIPFESRLLGVHRDTHPHWVVDYGCYAVTLRCKGTLPKTVQAQLREIGVALEAVEPFSEEAENYRRRHFAILEHALDRANGFSPFKNKEAASCMMEFLETYEFEGLSFKHWVIMPNHLHLVTAPMACREIDLFLNAWYRFKSRSARAINQSLGRNGSFWQSSWYDRWIRSSSEYKKWLGYLRENPFKAGLCKDPADYPYWK